MTVLPPRARANADQRAAADPAVSAFVAASAGSGKTKLLTDRLLRLMLAGAAPERILCLTFTKAAAAEMALRLQRRLGALGDAGRSGAGSRTLPRSTFAPTEADPPHRARAVRPGARPAGRDAHRHHPRLLPVAAAPLPAGGALISPHFQLVDDRDAAEALAEAREDMLARRQSRPAARRAA